MESVTCFHKGKTQRHPRLRANATDVPSSPLSSEGINRLRDTGSSDGTDPADSFRRRNSDLREERQDVVRALEMVLKMQPGLAAAGDQIRVSAMAWRSLVCIFRSFAGLFSHISPVLFFLLSAL